MKRTIGILLMVLSLCGAGHHVQAQELFVFTEPASNMPAHTIGLRASNWLMQARKGGSVYSFYPELMWGKSKHLMLHVEGFFSNQQGSFRAEGAGLYAKYRFYVRDTIYRHFRAAAFARLSAIQAPVMQEEIALAGHNSGYSLGLVGTQLLHRLALSSSFWWEHATDNLGQNELPAQQPGDALNLSLSGGLLILPKRYTGYQNLNLNLMAEVLSQQLIGSDKHFVDLAPSLQFIFNSQTRVDIGYRFELSGNMSRWAPNGALLRVEHLLFL
ncbi:MAG: hypothetical protein JST06_08440 [Bacteroidetes bacterium]|nr:hypothetical protein [Bacteroidota bacterium]MBS1628435.1 hypothetical protein [Bacteroidota bacterium]